MSTLWYRRDASWRATHGRSFKLHLPRGDGLALCSDIVVQDDAPGWEDPPDEHRCRKCTRLLKVVPAVKPTSGG